MARFLSSAGLFPVRYSIATFQFDVTPPPGHSLCGGWIPAVTAVDDPLSARGVVISGGVKPIVLCAVDWTGICNSAHYAWRKCLADAAGTTAQCVAVQCVHQHDAPFVCLEAEEIINAEGDLPHNVDIEFFDTCLKRAAEVVRESLKSSQPLTHIAASRALVDQVASNRRILGSDGRVKTNRSVSPNSDDVRDLPTGLIDPWLRTIGFYNGADKVAAFYYYAVHPISYCCQQGRVSSDFVGLARRLKEEHDSPGCLQVYFTGCAGNLNAGKYSNSGEHKYRRVLAERIYAAMEKASARLKPEPITSLRWKTENLIPPARDIFSIESLQKQISDKTKRVVHRNRPAFTLAWLKRLQKKDPQPIVLSGLHINNLSIIHLPAEPFVEFQLRTQVLHQVRFVAVAGYGDGGPWYIPTAEAYAQGGYEINVAFSNPQIDSLLMQGIEKLFA